MPKLLDELVKRLPRDCEEQVIRARDQNNGLTRRKLAHETRLAIAVDSSVPVHIMPGFPKAWYALDACDDERAAQALIAASRPEIEGLGRSSAYVADLLDKVESLAPGLVPSVERFTQALVTTQDLARALLDLATQRSLVRGILAIEDDILGVYFSEPGAYRIELYWAAIGIAAQELSVSIGDLATAVLIHELAHAYTIQGLDIDGRDWEQKLRYRDVERSVTEGLAQYYTHVVSRAMQSSPFAWGVHGAYRNLLAAQAGCYLVHRKWVDQFTGEVIRIALLKYRREHAREFGRFEQLLLEESQSLHDLRPQLGFDFLTS